MRKIILSIMLTLAMVLTMIPVMGSVAYAADKAVITSIEGTSNISEVLVLGQGLKNPTFTITAGSPAEYNDAGIMNWYRKVGESWVRCEYYQNVIPGEYCMRSTWFGVYMSNYDNYLLSDETTVTIDGVVWEKTSNGFRDGGSYCYVEIMSPVYTVADDPTKKIISSMELEYNSVNYDGTAKTPDVTVKDQSGNVLLRDTDYTVTYDNNTEVSSYATVKVDGINANGVFGTWSKYFKIENAPTPPVEKTKISSIEGTTNISELAKLGNNITNPTITITAGSPAHFNDAGIMNWYKKENGSWVRCQWNDTFTGGEYRLICMFGVYGTDFNEYTLDDNVTLKLDGAAWEINKAPITNTEDFFPYCYMEVVSPVYNVAEPISNAKDFDIFFEGDTTTYKYNGKVIKPIVYINNDKIHEALEQNVDYKVTFPSGMKDVGSYTVTIEGIGKYTGTVTKTYKIIPATPSIKSLTSGTKKLTVKMTTKPSSKGATTYQIYYKQKGTSSWKKTTTTAQSKTIKGLKKGKQYYVKIRAYKKVDTEIYYGAWSKAKLSKKIK